MDLLLYPTTTTTTTSPQITQPTTSPWNAVRERGAARTCAWIACRLDTSSAQCECSAVHFYRVNHINRRVPHM